jgi:hypothetical protein
MGQPDTEQGTIFKEFVLEPTLWNESYEPNEHIIPCHFKLVRCTKKTESQSDKAEVTEPTEEKNKKNNIKHVKFDIPGS